MARWVRFEQDGEVGFGTLLGDNITIHGGDMFGSPKPTGARTKVNDVRLLIPCQPTKMLALWNNYRALGTKLDIEPPAEPLFFIKAASCYADPDATVRRPPNYTGKVVFEGELGIVIGRTCSQADDIAAAAAIFGYTCVNDLTAIGILTRDPSFPQWARAKSADGFGPFGPAIATGLDPAALRVRTTLNGVERQDYPVADAVFGPVELVRLLSHELTLKPGDVICLGTSVGAGAMLKPVNTVEVSIEGIGTLRTTYLHP